MIEEHSATWRTVKSHTEAQIAESARRNEDVSLDAIGTAFERGRIAALRSVLALTNPRTVLSNTPVDEQVGF